MSWKTESILLCVSEWFSQIASHPFPILICKNWFASTIFPFWTESTFFVKKRHGNFEQVIVWKFCFHFFFVLRLSQFTKLVCCMSVLSSTKACYELHFDGELLHQSLNIILRIWKWNVLDIKSYISFNSISEKVR